VSGVDGNAGNCRTVVSECINFAIGRSPCNGKANMKHRWKVEPFGRESSGEKRAEEQTGNGSLLTSGSDRFFSSCASSKCRSGWLHLWRSRSVPVFEGGWTCSAQCTEDRVTTALRRELEGRREEPSAHRHRIPLGLVMLEQGWINSEQLRQALDAQKAAGQGKLGAWLVRQHGVQEQLVTRALSLQWGCPVLSADSHDAPALACIMPRLFVDAFGALPLRVAAGRLLYLGFEEQLDPILALALERMSGLRVETGLVRGSLFRDALDRMLTSKYPGIEMIESVSEQPLVRLLARTLERAKPVEARLVRVHDCLWMRLWLRPQNGYLPEIEGVRDVVCSLRSS